MRVSRFFYRTLKGIYDILATYLLAWILFFASLSVLFHFGLGGERATFALERAAHQLGLSSVALRLVVFGILHGVAIWSLRRHIARGQAFLERCFDALTAPTKRLLSSHPRSRLIIEGLFTLLVTAALIPFLLQPTLVAGFDRQSWLARGANLLDGTTTVMAADSIVGFYRLLVAEPESEEPLNAAEARQAISADSINRPGKRADDGPLGRPHPSRRPHRPPAQ